MDPRTEDMQLDQDSDRAGLGTLITRMADSLVRLFTQHLALAKVEIAQDVKVVGSNVARVAAFVPFVLVGYALLCIALSLFLSRWLNAAGGFAAVGGFNVLVGGVGIALAVRGLKGRALLSGSREEISRSAHVLGAAPNGEVAAAERIQRKEMEMSRWPAKS
jgi:hypothetical protein